MSLTKVHSEKRLNTKLGTVGSWRIMFTEANGVDIVTMVICNVKSSWLILVVSYLTI